MAALVLLCSLAWGATASAQQVQHLPSLEALRALCQRAQPEPGAAEDPRSWSKQRQEQMTRLYAVDIQAPHFRFADYDPQEQLLAVVDQESFGLLDGSYAIAPRGSSLLGFALPEEAAQLVQMDCGAQTAVLRLVFLLDAFSEPEQPWCRTNDKGVTVVQARVLSAQLFKTPAAGEDNPAAQRELARADYAEATAMATAIGAYSPRGQEPSRVLAEARKAWAVKGSFPPDVLESLRRDAQLLVRPCYLASLARGGPQSAALSINVTLGDGGRPQEIVPVVDAAGHEGLVRCSQRNLRYLSAPSSSQGDLLRFNFYFERH